MNVTNITVYRNVTVRDAVIGVSADRFGRHHDRPQRIAEAEVRQLTPVRGALDVKPDAASVERAVALREQTTDVRECLIRDLAAGLGPSPGTRAGYIHASWGILLSWAQTTSIKTYRRPRRRAT